jgi:hypothetical protein
MAKSIDTLAEETVVESPESPVEAIVVEDAPVVSVEPAEGFLVALDGDNYASIAERAGVNALDVFVLNNENPVYPGMLIRIK